MKEQNELNEELLKAVIDRNFELTRLHLDRDASVQAANMGIDVLH